MSLDQLSTMDPMSSHACYNLILQEGLFIDFSAEKQRIRDFATLLKNMISKYDVVVWDHKGSEDYVNKRLPMENFTMEGFQQQTKSYENLRQQTVIIEGKITKLFKKYHAVTSSFLNQVLVVKLYENKLKIKADSESKKDSDMQQIRKLKADMKNRELETKALFRTPFTPTTGSQAGYPTGYQAPQSQTPTGHVPRTQERSESYPWKNQFAPQFQAPSPYAPQFQAPPSTQFQGPRPYAPYQHPSVFGRQQDVKMSTQSSTPPPHSFATQSAGLSPYSSSSSTTPPPQSFATQSPGPGPSSSSTGPQSEGCYPYGFFGWNNESTF